MKTKKTSEQSKYQLLKVMDQLSSSDLALLYQVAVRLAEFHPRPNAKLRENHSNYNLIHTTMPPIRLVK